METSSDDKGTSWYRLDMTTLFWSPKENFNNSSVLLGGKRVSFNLLLSCYCRCWCLWLIDIAALWQCTWALSSGHIVGQPLCLGARYSSAIYPIICGSYCCCLCWCFGCLILLLFDRAHEHWAHCWAAMVLGGKAKLCNLKPSPSYNLTNHFDTTPAPHCNPRATLQRSAMRGNTLSICSITLKTLQRSPNAHQLGPKHFPYAKGQEELNVKVIWGSTWNCA